MRAIMVCVDYGDIASLTIPYNRHHFDDVCMVTVPRDELSISVAEANHCKLFITESFYDDGAAFNKWKALEKGLDWFGRTGYLCLMDADVCWPKGGEIRRYIHNGLLVTPLRRICDPIPGAVPPEEQWARYPVHRNVREWAGYSQVFHADDPHLGPAPWHQTDWRHAGGADSFFQEKWPAHCKGRPPWHVLHLGPPGVNWFGRSAPYVDGTVPDGAERRKQAYLDIWPQRRAEKAAGRDPFAPERLK